MNILNYKDQIKYILLLDKIPNNCHFICYKVVINFNCIINKMIP